MIISISGVPGSGKTSVAKLLAQRLGLKFYSMGELRGKMATERGLTIDELNKLGEQADFTDKTVDDYQRELGKKEDNFVIEGRLSWHFIPNSIKVFLDCKPQEAARRIFEARRSKTAPSRYDEPKYQTVEQTLEEIQKRMASDHLRYQKYYGLEYREPTHYDLILDTTNLPGPEATVEKIASELENLQTKI